MWAFHKVEWRERDLLWIGDNFCLDQCSEQWYTRVVNSVHVISLLCSLQSCYFNVQYAAHFAVCSVQCSWHYTDF